MVANQPLSLAKADGLGTTRETWRIGDVTEVTGLSKELIHHYLRQKLVPRSRSRARYTAQQVRLLQLIRTLREDHNIPLEIIRQLFAQLHFEVDKLQSVTLGESLCKRLTQFAGGDLLNPGALSESELAAAAGVELSRVEEYLRAGIVRGFEAAGAQRFSTYDASVITLCERGLELGVPFESLRVTASYIHVAFELEKDGFLGLQRPQHEGEEVLSDLFLRRELLLGFVQSMLLAVIARHLRAGFEPAACYAGSLDNVVYRPSTEFVRKHGLAECIEQAQQRCVGAKEPAPWLFAARLLLHAGRYHEAVFLLGECLERWQRPEVAATYGKALLLAGDREGGTEHLERAAADRPADPATTIYLCLAQLEQARAEDRVEVLVRRGAAILTRIGQALDACGAVDVDGGRLEARILGSWLLTTLPPVFQCQARGRQLLGATLRQLGQADGALLRKPPGLADRLRLNAAFLLFRCLCQPRPDGAEPAEPAAPLPSLEDLRTLICRLDPACAFARQAFLEPCDETHSTY